MKLQKFRSAFGRVVVVISYISMALLFAMVFIVAIDVILRKFQLGRINGSNELTTNFMVAVCMLGIPVLQLKHGHVWVNLFVNKFPKRFRSFWLFVIMIVETAVIALFVIGAYNKIVLFAQRSSTTDILNIPRWIFAVACMLAFTEYFILSVIDTVTLCMEGVRNEQTGSEGESWSEDDVKGI